MLRKSSYRHRFLFAVIASAVLILLAVVIILNTFIWPEEKNPLITPVANITFTPVPTQPEATPVEKVFTDTDYVDEHILIHIEKFTEPNLVYYVADIRLDSVQYFKNSFAKDDRYRLKCYEALSHQAKRHNAILAINSDDCGIGDNPRKFTIRNGTLYRERFDDEILVLMPTGEMRIVKGVSGQMLIEQGVLHSWSFGPTLVLDGQYVERTSKIAVANPRTGMGMVEPLHYIFIVVDGRNPGYSTGLAMADFAQLFVRYGCKVAYNLDGGGSSAMYFHNRIISKPDDGEHTGKERWLTDIIYIGLE